jgi:hypothetical protein
LDRSEALDYTYMTGLAWKAAFIINANGGVEAYLGRLYRMHWRQHGQALDLDLPGFPAQVHCFQVEDGLELMLDGHCWGLLFQFDHALHPPAHLWDPEADASRLAGGNYVIGGDPLDWPTQASLGGTPVIYEAQAGNPDPS